MRLQVGSSASSSGGLRAAPRGGSQPSQPVPQLQRASILHHHANWQQPTAAAAQRQRRPAASASGGGAGGGGDSFFESGREGAERQRLFNTIAPVYDQLNDELSLGLHRVWKRMAVKWSGARTGATALDVCCGSGDLAFRLAEAVGPSGRTVGLDFSANMLEDAARRQAARRQALGPAYDMEWVQVRAAQWWQGAMGGRPDGPGSSSIAPLACSRC